MDSGTITYWIYCNSKRLILITRSGAQDYTSTYVGFMSAFGTPDQYPFPLVIASSSPAETTFIMGNSNNQISSCADPGLSCGLARLWDGTILPFGNRPPSAAQNLYAETPPAWIWPYHTGSASFNSWPFATIGDSNSYNGHMFDRLIPNAQGELPLFPCSLQSGDYSNIGVLDGVFAIPSGGTLTPTQLITIGADDYRIFPNRTRRDGVNWMAIRED